MFTLFACGDDHSDDSNTPNLSDPNTNDPNTIQPSTTAKVFPYGYWQTLCHSFGMYSNIPAYENMGVILTEEYDKERKMLIQTSYAYDKEDNNLCAIPMFKLSYYSYFDNIIYNPNTDLYTAKITFVRATATPGSTYVATNWNNSNYMGINTWTDRVEKDITGRNADGSTFIPESTTYKIISLTNNNTQMIQNESSNGYPSSVDYGYVFFKHD